MTREYSDDELNRALQYDGLAEAEQVTGKSYKEDIVTKITGFELHMRNVQAKRRMLASRNDSYYGISLEQYVQIVQDLGFERILLLPFKYEERKETLQIWWHREGVLLAFDTYCGDRVNEGNFYYNWKSNNNPPQYGDWLSNCSWNSGIVIGRHDCREAIRYNFQHLKEKGSFVLPWIEQPFLWLLNYEDTKVKGYDYKKINAERIAMLPEYVRMCI